MARQVGDFGTPKSTEPPVFATNVDTGQDLYNRRVSELLHNMLLEYDKYNDLKATSRRLHYVERSSNDYLVCVKVKVLIVELGIQKDQVYAKYMELRDKVKHEMGYCE